VDELRARRKQALKVSERSVVAAIASVRRTISTNERLRTLAGHEAGVEESIDAAEQELCLLEAELGVLRRDERWTPEGSDNTRETARLMRLFGTEERRRRR
jgi:hypothetical protein